MKPIYLFREATPLRKLLMERMLTGGSSAVEATATGNPLSFLTDLSKPLRSVLATWQPHQTGSGDPSPENVRPVVGMDGVNVWHTGKNLLNPVWWDDVAENKSYVRYEDGTLVYQANAYKASDYVIVMGNTEYTLHAGMGGQQAGGMAFYDSSKQYISGTHINNNTKTDHTFTTPSNAAYMRFWDKNDIVPWDEVMLVYGSTAPTAYEPYSGTSYSVAFPALGKNLFHCETGEKNEVTLTLNADGSYSMSGTAIGSGKWTGEEYLTAGTYAVSVNATGLQGESSVYLRVKDENNTTISTFFAKPSAPSPTGTFTIASSGYYTFSYEDKNTENYDGVKVYVQIEKGSSATAWEPYTATVYGGSLDLTTGVLTATHGYKQLTSPMIQEEYTYNGMNGVKTFSSFLPAPALRLKGICSHCPKVGSYYVSNSMWIGVSSTDMFWIGILDELNLSTIEDFKDWLDTQTVQIVWELETPIAFQLSPTQITALIGNNTMWADADSLSVTYMKKG